jgi:large subunit ribosomal protein L3
MLQGLLGRKVAMTQIFAEDGSAVPVTVVQAGPCVITQIKTTETDGYSAVQLGYGSAKRYNKPSGGHLNGLDAAVLREFRTADVSTHSVGDQVDVTLFDVDDLVNVAGVSKGRGFAGVMKRHNFRGGPKTHGQSDRARAPGSIGATTTPGRVLKGKRMPGRMGGERVTVRNVRVAKLDEERNLLFIEGAVPGAPNGILEIRRNR